MIITASNKDIAQQFLDMIVTGKIDEAFEKHVDPNGKHHNVFFPGDMSVLRDAMKQNHLQFPDKKLHIKHAIAEDDLVAVHSHLVLSSKEPGMITFHLMRFKDGKIVEFWDCGQQIPADSSN